MLIGIDFDNTIINYHDIFHTVAVDKRLVPPHVPRSKNAVRDYLRAKGQEQEWTALQGYVYGIGIEKARPFTGVMDFLQGCKRHGIGTVIISHKTRYPVKGPRYDLRNAAMKWLETQGFFDTRRTGLSEQMVHFSSTIEEKVRTIGETGCTAFIDDLLDIFIHADFPGHIHKYLFAPHGKTSPCVGITVIEQWQELTEMVTGRTS